MVDEDLTVSSPTPIVVRLQTPVPVTVHGQVPIVAHSAVPVTAQSPLPVDVLQGPHGDATIAIATLIVAGITLLAVFWQIFLATKELRIIARSADLLLRSRDKSNTVKAAYQWQQWHDPDNGENVARGLLTVPLSIANVGTRGVTEAVLYLWFPPHLSPNSVYDPASPWRKESDSRDIRGVRHQLRTYTIDRRLYPKPFSTDETLYFLFDDRRPIPDQWPPNAPPPSQTIYWQIVCDDGTFLSPDFLAELNITF